MQTRAQSTAIPASDVAVTPNEQTPQSKGHVLSDQERLELQEYEQKVTRNQQNFAEEGTALKQIRDKELYREQYATFEQYCSAKWHYARAHVYRLIAAAETFEVLSPFGDKIRPTHESQLRPLAKLTPEQVKSAWADAVTKADGGPITAKLVAEAAAQFKKAKKRARLRKVTISSETVAKMIASLTLVENTLKKAQTSLALEYINNVKNSLEELSNFRAAAGKPT